MSCRADSAGDCDFPQSYNIDVFKGISCFGGSEEHDDVCCNMHSHISAGHGMQLRVSGS